MTTLLLAIIYLAFISLGLPDTLLGSGWPSMYRELSAQLSWSGIISMIIASGTVVSSLMSDRLTRKFGAGGVTAISVAMTAGALFGFSISTRFWMLCLWAIPYGLGAGSVDAALNNYVALHYTSRHMSWLHCMWGVGASISPYIMSYALTGGAGWHGGYRYVSLIQIGLTIILILSLPLWKKRPETAVESDASATPEALSLRDVLRIPGSKEIMVCFFCYSMIEQTPMLWASSYLVSVKGIDAITAAGFASLFTIGIMIGRAASGFITMKLDDENMIRMGQGLIAIGILLMLLPLTGTAYVGLIIIGLGCAPIYPCIIHSTPAHFGAERSQAIIGIQMASAYVGTTLMPPFFGWLSRFIGLGFLPIYLAFALAAMILLHERLCRVTEKSHL